MDRKINSLIPFDTLCIYLEHVLPIVEKNRKVVLLKDNKPVYIVMKYDDQAIGEDSSQEKLINYTLQEAMKIVLTEAEDMTMLRQNLQMKYMNADCIYRRMVIKPNTHKLEIGVGYPDMFEALPGNYIKIKERV